MHRSNNRHSKYGRATIPVELPKPPGFICNGLNEYVKIFRGVIEEFHSQGDPKKVFEKYSINPNKQPTFPTKLLLPTVQEIYDQNGEFSPLCLSDYNSKRPKQSRKILSAEEAESMVVVAEKAVASSSGDVLQKEQSFDFLPDVSSEPALTSSSSEKAETDSSFYSESDSELGAEIESSSTHTTQEAERACSSNQSAQEQISQTETIHKLSMDFLPPCSSTTNRLAQPRDRKTGRISILIFNRGGYRNIVLVESRSKTAIFLKTITAEKCVQKLEHDFLPYYDYFTGKRSEWFETEGTRKQFSEHVTSRHYDLPENRVIQFALVKMARNTCDSLILQINESFRMVTLDKSVNHEISVPACILPMFVQELKEVLQELKSAPPPLRSITSKHAVATTTSAEEESRLKAILKFTYVLQDSKRFIRVEQVNNSRGFVVLSLAAAVECVYNLTTLNVYHKNLDTKQVDDSSGTFIMTRNVVSKGGQGQFLVNFGVNNVEYFVSIKSFKNGMKRNYISISADLIEPLRLSLRSMTSEADACLKCGTVWDHHQNQCNFSNPPSRDANNNIPKPVDRSMGNHRDDALSQNTNFQPRQQFNSRTIGRRFEQSATSNFSYNNNVGNFRVDG